MFGPIRLYEWTSLLSLRRLQWAVSPMGRHRRIEGLDCSLGLSICYLQKNPWWVDEWLRAFPEKRFYVPLLLLGYMSVSSHPIAKKIIGKPQRLVPLLEQWRNESTDEDFLLGSERCEGYFYMANEFDILEVANRALTNPETVNLSLTPEQSADLKLWCGRLMSQRAELKAAKGK